MKACRFFSLLSSCRRQPEPLRAVGTYKCALGHLGILRRSHPITSTRRASVNPDKGKALTGEGERCYGAQGGGALGRTRAASPDSTSGPRSPPPIKPLTPPLDSGAPGTPPPRLKSLPPPNAARPATARRSPQARPSDKLLRLDLAATLPHRRAPPARKSTTDGEGPAPRRQALQGRRPARSKESLAHMELDALADAPRPSLAYSHSTSCRGCPPVHHSPPLPPFHHRAPGGQERHSRAYLFLFSGQNLKRAVQAVLTTYPPYGAGLFGGRHHDGADGGGNLLSPPPGATLRLEP